MMISVESHDIIKINLSNKRGRIEFIMANADIISETNYAPAVYMK